MTKNIKQFSTEEIERAISEALTKLLGSEHKFVIGKIDFSGYERLGSVALIPIEATISKISPHLDFMEK
jgi:hypothetical protein